MGRRSIRSFMREEFILTIIIIIIESDYFKYIKPFFERSASMGINS